MIVGVPREIKIQEYRIALTNVILPFAIQIANLGWEKALRQNPDLTKGLNTHAGEVTYEAVAEAHGYEFSPVL